VIPSIEIGSHFSTLAQQLNLNYSVESLLAKHTIYPYYAPFLSRNRKKEIIEDVLGDGQGLYTRLGMVAGGICKKDGLFYCPECATNDIEKYGEPYIHREHQLQGIVYCAHHELKLKKYPIDFSKSSRIEYIRFDKKLMNFPIVQEEEPKEFQSIQIALAKMAYQLLQNPIYQISRESVSLKYRALLRVSNLITTSNRIRQYDLCKAFQSKFPKGFLEKYESAINENDEYNWLKVITRKIKRHVHPFRHLLLLYFLEQDVESFMQIEDDTGPFGRGPWPCLNNAASHYKQNVISDVIITRDFKMTNPIGTFSCSCGFKYARKGPDQFEEDKYRVGRVKNYGDVWQKRLNELADACLSLRAIARELNVDSKTVKKYLANREELINIKIAENNSLSEQYRSELLEEMSHSSHITRIQIRRQLPKQYMFLYRHDKEWLFTNLPTKRKKEQPTQTVDWVLRDQEYYKKIKHFHYEILILEKPVRITQSLIGKRLGILANLERHLVKLPRTKKLLNEIKETVHDFQIRRCYKIIDQMLLENEPILLWKVQRVGAVKSHHFHKIKLQLEAYIQMKQGSEGE
jgi:hypothetical protein